MASVKAGVFGEKTTCSWCFANQFAGCFALDWSFQDFADGCAAYIEYACRMTRVKHRAPPSPGKCAQEGKLSIRGIQSTPGLSPEWTRFIPFIEFDKTGSIDTSIYQPSLGSIFRIPIHGQNPCRAILYHALRFSLIGNVGLMMRKIPLSEEFDDIPAMRQPIWTECNSNVSFKELQYCSIFKPSKSDSTMEYLMQWTYFSWIYSFLWTFKYFQSIN
jgi:hypothetical protein